MASKKTAADLVAERIEQAKRARAATEKRHIKEPWRGIDKTEIPCLEVELKILLWCHERIVEDSQQDMFLIK